MKSDQYLLCFVNFLSAMGYSLIAPIYPPIALKRISVSMCGVVIGAFALSQTVCVLFSPFFISRFGRKKLFFFSTFSLIICTFVYGLLDSFTSNFLFLVFSLFIRIAHGFLCGIVNVLSYSMTSIINDPSDMKEAMGYMEFAWSSGLAFGPFVIAVFRYIGGYFLPFIAGGAINVLGFLALFKIEFPEEQDSSEEGSSKKSSSILPFLFHRDILLIAGSGMIQLNAQTFFFPTLSNYLNEKFGLSVEMASLFFITPVFAYFIGIQFINRVTDRFGLKLTIIIGLIFSCLGTIFIAPAPFLPYLAFTVLLGLFIVGGQAAFVNVPMFVELNTYVKDLHACTDSESGDKASALFNLAFNIGDFWSPVVGAYVTGHVNFQASCYLSGIIDLVYAYLLWHSFREEITNSLSEKKDIRAGRLIESA